MKGIAEEEKKEDDTVPVARRFISAAEDGRHSSKAKSKSIELKQDEALAYLARYETMVRQQEAEDMATLTYMKPCLERLRQLGEGLGSATAPAAEVGIAMDQMLTFRCLKVARDRLDEIERDFQRQRLEKEFLATDKQLLMVLRILTQDMTDDNSSEDDLNATLTWAEFVQCYKVCIAGMLTLQQLATTTVPPTKSRCSKGGRSDADAASISSLRSRTRDRTVSMMSLFGPSSTRVLAVEEDSRSRPVRSRATKLQRLATTKAGAGLLLAAGAVVAAWFYLPFVHEASFRSRAKPPRYVALTSLYPPNFYNASPLAPKSDSVAPASSPSAIYQNPFPTTVHHQRPVGVVLAARVTPPKNNQFVKSQSNAPFFAPLPLSSSTELTQGGRQVRAPADVWYHAVGGAVVFPLVTQLLFSPAVAGRFIATASLLTVAAAGAVANLLSDALARLLSVVRRRFLNAIASQGLGYNR
jgi:hypothetical protein